MSLGRYTYQKMHRTSNSIIRECLGNFQKGSKGGGWKKNSKMTCGMPIEVGAEFYMGVGCFDIADQKHSQKSKQAIKLSNFSN